MTVEFLDDAKEIANNREMLTYRKGVYVTVTSTGMRCLSAAIAVEFMYATQGFDFRKPSELGDEVKKIYN